VGDALPGINQEVIGTNAAALEAFTGVTRHQLTSLITSLGGKLPHLASWVRTASGSASFFAC
jgi:hypothetical protein